MRDKDLENRHIGWIAAWGVVVLVLLGIGAIIANQAAKPFDTTIWLLLTIFAVVGVFALYMTFSPLLNRWPYREHKDGAKLNDTVVTPSADDASQVSGRRARNLSDVFKNPEFADDTVNRGTEIPVDMDALQPVRRPTPDFSPEVQRFRQIDQDFDDSEESVASVDQWISDVHDKLEGWIPRNALRFIEEPPLDLLTQAIVAPFSGRRDLSDYPDLGRLHRARERLRRIVDQ